ncbi:MAG: 30S ribosomal protein S23 [Candidatus Berkelbacteria bacterium Athens1014_28]|uniref:30S ribosomal protein S23 n=1 Tax=Candidatus Berkelbacteria bacterium Athens1014_28 TaxID=2017145 RepID=A0A554LN46_9BACT|nr:MAG: 30S ribosomal protein S23 [Candidatus Berkelbacteria bacterium Athens1014_28]
MKIERFEDIICWQKSRVLVNDCFLTFKYLKDYSFKDQLLRCAVSIMNNIAEGYERQTNKEFKNFLYIAKGSAGELRSMLYLAKDLDYISGEKFKQLSEKSLEIAKILSGFIQKLK